LLNSGSHLRTKARLWYCIFSPQSCLLVTYFQLCPMMTSCLVKYVITWYDIFANGRARVHTKTRRFTTMFLVCWFGNGIFNKERIQVLVEKNQNKTTTKNKKQQQQQQKIFYRSCICSIWSVHGLHLFFT